MKSGCATSIEGSRPHPRTSLVSADGFDFNPRSDQAHYAEVGTGFMRVCAATRVRHGQGPRIMCRRGFAARLGTCCASGAMLRYAR